MVLIGCFPPLPHSLSVSILMKPYIQTQLTSPYTLQPQIDDSFSSPMVVFHLLFSFYSTRRPLPPILFKSLKIEGKSKSSCLMRKSSNQDPIKTFLLNHHCKILSLFCLFVYLETYFQINAANI